MFIVFSIRDARRFLSNWQYNRRQKKESKIQESYSKGLDAFFACRYEEAEDLFKRVIDEDPSNVNTLLRMGDIAFNGEDHFKAKDFYTKAKEIKPRSVEVLLSLAKVFEAQEKWQEALKYLDTVLEIDEENPEILIRKRDIFERSRKWEEVLEVQYKILKCDLSPEDEREEQKKLLGFKYELGCHYLETNNTEKTVKIAEVHYKDGQGFYISLYSACRSISERRKYRRSTGNSTERIRNNIIISAACTVGGFLYSHRGARHNNRALSKGDPEKSQGFKAPVLSCKALLPS
jgi:tetratricopeptide (TPR) repeat protein